MTGHPTYPLSRRGVRASGNEAVSRAAIRGGHHGCHAVWMTALGRKGQQGGKRRDQANRSDSESSMFHVWPVFHDRLAQLCCQANTLARTCVRMTLLQESVCQGDHK